MRRILVGCIATFVAAACTGNSTAPGASTPPPDSHPVVVSAPTSKQTGRLSLSQLRGSFPVVLGNDAADLPITWNAGTASSPQSGFDLYASTLGEADFVNRTEDDRDASPIYVKFMDDAARSACTQALAADKTRSNAEERTLLRYVSLTDTPESNDEGFRQNFAYLKLRFHGIKVTDDSQIESLMKLFVESGKGSKTAEEDGWRAVCVALLTAPEFHLY